MPGWTDLRSLVGEEFRQSLEEGRDPAELWHSRGDFSTGITRAVMGGWDTDCNGATVGSILGAMNGARKLPDHWTGRFHDTLLSEITGYHPIAISECARRSADIALAVARDGMIKSG